MTGAASLEFKPEIDRFRGFAIFLVVESHALILAQETPLGDALCTSVKGATWPFVFIAGYLFAHLRNRYGYGEYLGKKLSSVIAPYCIIVSLIVLAGLPRVEIVDPWNAWRYYTLGYPAATPLWFVPMIALTYLLQPLYRALCERPRLLLWLTALSVLFSALIERPSFDAGPIPNFAYFQSAFLFGLSWRVHQGRFDAFVADHYPLVILLLIVGVNVGMGETAVFRHGQIFAYLPLTMLLVPAMRAASALNPMWEWLASRSFGIFFLHGIVVDLLLAHSGRDQNPVLVMLGGIALTYACGVAVSAIRHLAGPRSRLLVGA
jgi:fucose 4-O-acetylase-like acetyltransferase